MLRIAKCVTVSSNSGCNAEMAKRMHNGTITSAEIKMGNAQGNNELEEGFLQVMQITPLDMYKHSREEISPLGRAVERLRVHPYGNLKNAGKSGQSGLHRP